jgi:hypothetical protein
MARNDYVKKNIKRKFYKETGMMICLCLMIPWKTNQLSLDPYMRSFKSRPSRGK